MSRISQPAQGGNLNDYVNWALAVSGVTRAWCYPIEQGPGTVTVRFMMDNTYTNGIPLTADVATVQTAINVLAPVTATVTVVAPVANPLNPTITGLTPNNANTQAAVTAELAALIQSQSKPGGTILISQIREAIGFATGVTDYTLTTPAANVTNTTGNITTLGTITWA